jgi:hypothetical protein
MSDQCLPFTAITNVNNLLSTGIMNTAPKVGDEVYDPWNFRRGTIQGYNPRNGEITILFDAGPDIIPS